MRQDVFVSYSTRDKTITDSIVASLEKNHIRCWYAPRDIQPSEDWGKAISNAIEQSKVFLLIFSGNSNQSQRVLDELNFAISQQIPILPFRVENLEPDGAMRLHLSSRHWLDAYDPSWESHIQKLVHAVSSNLETTIAEEDVEVPETIFRTQKIFKDNRRRILAGIAAVLVVAVVIFVWIGLSDLRVRDQALEVDAARTEEPSGTATPQPTLTPEASPTPSITPTPMETLQPTRVSEVDGMEMVYIPAVSFQMGSEDEEEDEQPVHEVYLDAYWIDRYEVTNAMYAECEAAGACDTYHITSSSTHDDYFGDAAYADYPVIYVSWYGAEDYCTWAGRRLPTEAEWEHAARSDDGRAYPWGNESPTCELANYQDCVGDTSEVGMHPTGASPYGVEDMAGNVWEWVADWYDENAYNYSSASNPTGPSSGRVRVVRGGSWFNSIFGIRSADRYWHGPERAYSNLGFRCAFDASP